MTPIVLHRLCQTAGLAVISLRGWGYGSHCVVVTNGAGSDGSNEPPSLQRRAQARRAPIAICVYTNGSARVASHPGAGVADTYFVAGELHEAFEEAARRAFSARTESPGTASAASP